MKQIPKHRFWVVFLLSVMLQCDAEESTTRSLWVLFMTNCHVAGPSSERVQEEFIKEAQRHQSRPETHHDSNDRQVTENSAYESMREVCAFPSPKI